MTPKTAEAYALSLPGAWQVVQWMGSHVCKIGPKGHDKVFAIFAPEKGRVTLKCADIETADFLIEIGAAERAPHLPRGGWIALKVVDVGEDELCERIETSYKIIRASLPKSIQSQLP